jgi:two-component system, cell cycle sensor histidine kinase and response regulator CckA
MSVTLSFPVLHGTTASAIVAAAFDACPEALAVVDRDSVVHANPAFARLVGYDSATDLCGKALADLLPPSSAGPYPASGTSFPKPGSNGDQARITDRHASCDALETSGSPFQWEGHSLQVLTVRHLHSQASPHPEVDNERCFRAIFEAAAIGICRCTMDGRVVESNPALQRMLGYTGDELRGMHFRQFSHPDDIALRLQLFEEMVAGQRDSYQLEVRYPRPEGQREGWVRLTVSLLRGPEGEPEYSIGMMEDITDRKFAEEQLREAQRMETVGRLAGGIAHDFNNLLTAVSLYSDLIAAGLPSNSGLHRHVDEIKLAGEQGAALVQQLLAVARQQPIQPQVLSINHVLESMRNLLARLIGEQIELTIAPAVELGAVRIDPTQMRQIILNLVLNARDAMPTGGRLLVETSDCTSGPLCAKNFLSHPCVRLNVTDTGCGMHAETRSHLFEPFFTTKDPGQGNGLGLATVHDIVTQAGGEIRVQSQPGKGTCMSVYLPRTEVSAEQLTPDPPLAAAQTGHETILLVEDDAAVRASTRSVLSDLGYTVLEAANQDEAVRLAGEYPGTIQLLLQDLVMPGAGGFDVARRLHRLRPALRVLFVTGFSHGVSAPDPKSDQPFALLRKPFSSSALARAVRDVLDPSPQTKLKHQKKKR